MLVLITSKSNPSPDTELKRRLNILRSRGVDVLVLGIGDVNTEMLQSLTNPDPSIEDRVLLTKYASGLLQYSQDIADFACGEGKGLFFDEKFQICCALTNVDLDIRPSLRWSVRPIKFYRI